MSYLQDWTTKASKANGSTLTFHLIVSDSMLQSLSRNKTMQSFAHPPGMKGAIGFYKTLPDFVVAWSDEEYIQCVNDCVDIFESVNPDVIVAEVAFSQAREACNIISREYMVLSPNAALEYFSASQPWLGMIWKYPA